MCKASMPLVSAGPRRLRGEKLNYKSVAKEISKPPSFLVPEVQWASKFTVFVRFTFLNHAHIWYVT